MSSKTTRATFPLAGLWQRHTFRLHIAVLFTGMVLLAGCVLIWSNYIQGRDMVLSAAQDAFERIEREAGSAIQQLRLPVEAFVDLASRAQIVDATRFDTRMQSLPTMAETLSRHAMLGSVYVGYGNGDFFQLHALRTDADRQRFTAPPNAAYRLQYIERNAKLTQIKLLDAALTEISELPAPPDGVTFDPRTRPWYADAMRESGIVRTPPYVFFATQEVGLTIARRAAHGRAVVGADITLRQLSQTLARARPSPSSQLAVFGEDHRVIAHSLPARAVQLDAEGRPVLARIADLSPVLAAAASDAQGRTVDAAGREWLVRSVPMSRGNGGTNYLAVAAPSDELLVGARAALHRNLWIALAITLIVVPLVWWLAHRIAANLNALTAQAAMIRRFKFDHPAPLRSHIIEISELGSAMGQLQETVRKFMEITSALSAERKFDRLLRRVLREASDAAGAEGGVIYLLDDEGGMLTPAHHSWDDGDAAHAAAPSAIPMQAETSPAVRTLTSCAAAGTEILLPERPEGMGFLDAHFGRMPVVLVAVPLLNRSGTAIGVLCVFLRDTTAQPSPDRLALVQAFAGAAAVAIDNQRLLASEKALLDALINLTAGAIDAKSPYTGGHCQRVPELTNMLAQAACEQKEGPFAAFDLNEDQWEALHIAGGLHDCGKVTTPEYVVDKATKLETICDRIHEIRMRFEVLKRDAEISCLRAIAAGGDEARLSAELAATLHVLDEEFAFVAACNEGGEFMAPEKIERLKAIARRTWQRTLDDRLGVSRDEAERKARNPALPLPATEFLLADKPEHIITRQASDRISDDNPWGFKLQMPQALYNRGELHNLSIARGTLTEEERYKINDHIVQTIIMLSALPFPKHLKLVPELAGGHHEKMDGTGYPKRLRREDMSVQARIMAIADIFEALTAADRPYKKAKKLSEAIKIMAFMKKDRHIDPDLFDLFLTSGVYRRYAEKFMQPQYIDDVDISACLGMPA